MLARLRFLLLLAVLFVGSGACFGLAAAQAGGPPPPPPPPVAAKAAAQAAAASAKGDADSASAIEAGENIGEILQGWGAALLLGIGGLMGFAALFKRSVGEGLTVLVIVVIVGGFIYAPEQVQAFIESVWKPIGG